MKPKSFVKGKNPAGAQKPKDIKGKAKEAKLPNETKASFNMGKKDCRG